MNAFELKNNKKLRKNYWVKLVLWRNKVSPVEARLVPSLAKTPQYLFVILVREIGDCVQV